MRVCLRLLGRPTAAEAALKCRFAGPANNLIGAAYKSNLARDSDEWNEYGRNREKSNRDYEGRRERRQANEGSHTERRRGAGGGRDRDRDRQERPDNRGNNRRNYSRPSNGISSSSDRPSNEISHGIGHVLRWGPKKTPASFSWGDYLNLSKNPVALRNAPPWVFKRTVEAITASMGAWTPSGAPNPGTLPRTEARDRIKWMLRDLRSLGLDVDVNLADALSWVTRGTFENYKQAVDHLRFCADHNAVVKRDSYTFARVLHDLAERGNYTASMRLFDEMLSPTFSAPPKDMSLWLEFILAVVKASPSSSEKSLGNYVVEQHRLADLNLGLAASAELDKPLLDSRPLEQILDEEDFPTDFYSNQIPPGSITKSRKLLAIFKHVWNLKTWTDYSKRRLHYSMIRGFQDLGQWILVRKFIDLMSTPPYNVSLTPLLHQEMIQIGATTMMPNKLLRLEPETRSNLMRDMVKTAERSYEELKTLMPKDDLNFKNAQTDMVVLCVRCGLFEKATEIFGEMKAAHTGPTFQLYQDLIHDFARKGDAAAALALFRQVVLRFTWEHHDKNLASLIRYLIRFFLTTRDYGAAVEVWQFALSQGDDARLLNSTLYMMMIEFASRGDGNKLVTCLELLPNVKATSEAVWNSTMTALVNIATAISRQEGDIEDLELGRSYYQLYQGMLDCRTSRRPFDKSLIPPNLKVALAYFTPRDPVPRPPRFRISHVAQACEIASHCGTAKDLDTTWSQIRTSMPMLREPIESWPVATERAQAGDVYGTYVESLCRLGRYQDAREFVVGEFAKLAKGAMDCDVGMVVPGRLLMAWTAPARNDIDVASDQEPTASIDELEDQIRTVFGEDCLLLAKSYMEQASAKGKVSDVAIPASVNLGQHDYFVDRFLTFWRPRKGAA